MLFNFENIFFYVFRFLILQFEYAINFIILKICYYELFSEL